MQTYPWFDQVPEHLKTRRQLAELGLRPGGPVVAQVVWRKGEAFANLYDVGTAKPKREMTEAQRAALEKAHQAQRRCPGCRRVFEFVLPWRWEPWRDCPVCRIAGVTQDARTWLRSPRTIILDTETTDLHGYLVQIAVIRAHDGAVLFESLVNPLSPVSPGARRVHGITDEQLATAPAFEYIADELLPLLIGRRVVTYNADFDSGILRNELRRLAGGYSSRYADDAVLAILGRMRWRCAMELYAQFCGDWSDYHGDFRYQPLPGGDHSALGDARACREVLIRMAEAKEKTTT